MNNLQVIHNYKTEQEWLAIRKKFVTSTQVASIFGCGFETPLEVYSSFVDGYEKKFNNEEILESGRVLEHPIAKLFGNKYGLKVKANKKFISKGMIGSSFDYEIVGIKDESKIPADMLFVVEQIKQGKRVNLEIKTVTSYKWYEDWQGEGLPVKYMYQTQTQMYCGEYDYTVVATIFDNIIHYRTMQADEFIQSNILDKVSEFMSMVEKKTPPPADYSKDNGVLTYRILNDFSEDLGLNAEESDVEDYFTLEKKIKEMEASKTKLRAKILEVSHEVGTYKGYKLQKAGRGLSIKEIK